MANEILTPATRYAQTANLPSGVYDSNDMAEAVAAALAQFDRDQPQETVAKFAGDGGSTYDLSAKVTAWDEDESSVLAVAYPYSAADENPLEDTEWYVVNDPTDGRTLVLDGLEPAATEDIRLTFTAPWTEGAVPSGMVHPVAKLAAANYLLMMAARFAQGTESTITADTFSGQTIAQTMTSLARDLQKEYNTAVGISRGSAGGAAGGDTGAQAAADWISMGDTDPEDLIEYGN